MPHTRISIDLILHRCKTGIQNFTFDHLLRELDAIWEQAVSTGLRGHLSAHGLSLSKLIFDRSKDVQHPSSSSVITQMAFDDGVAVTRLLGQCQPRQHAVLQYDMLAEVFGCLRPLAAAFMCLISRICAQVRVPRKMQS